MALPRLAGGVEPIESPDEMLGEVEVLGQDVEQLDSLLQSCLEPRTAPS